METDFLINEETNEDTLFYDSGILLLLIGMNYCNVSSLHSTTSVNETGAHNCS